MKMKMLEELVSKLQGYVPNFLKPILRPLYYRLQKATMKHKPRDELHRFWKHPWDSSKNLPIDYLHVEEWSQFLVELIKRYVEPNAKILEIGCNVGRNLNCLFNAGYTKLGGVEISEDAIDLMKQAYPEMAKQIKIWNTPIEDVIKNFEDDSFDVIFTMAVLEHIHPDSEFTFPEMVRITSKYIITIEDEKGVSWRHFPRNYKKIFESLGTKQIYEFDSAIERREIEGLGSTIYARVFKKIKEDNCE
jgi:SAM-dependent methyltransferase